jgi:predicted Rossmann fold flavoprotein
MDASRHWLIAHEPQRRVELRCNFLPGDSFEMVDAWLTASGTAKPRAAIGRWLGQRLPERMALALLSHLGIAAATPLGQLPRAARRPLVHALTAYELPVTAARGWNFAEVTAGGVPLDEIDYRTMMSRRVPGLYLAGEVLDCDGRIGGFNFQWAWATGYLAGRAAAAQG